MTAAAISATPTTPPTTPPAIAPVFELVFEEGLEVPEGEAVSDAGARVDVGLREPVDWALVAVDSGLSERSDECYVGWLWKWKPTANRLSKRCVEQIARLQKNP